MDDVGTERGEKVETHVEVGEKTSVSPVSIPSASINPFLFK
jgi:hypothetical protein